MTTKVEFYSQLRDLVGASELEITLPDGSTVETLLGELSARAQRLHEGAAERLRHRLVELVWHRAPHVVGLDDPAQVDHSLAPLVVVAVPTSEPSAVALCTRVSPEVLI